jgi:hypothetical protein
MTKKNKEHELRTFVIPTGGGNPEVFDFQLFSLDSRLRGNDDFDILHAFDL